MKREDMPEAINLEKELVDIETAIDGVEHKNFDCHVSRYGDRYNLTKMLGEDGLTAALKPALAARRNQIIARLAQIGVEA